MVDVVILALSYAPSLLSRYCNWSSAAFTCSSVAGGAGVIAVGPEAG